MKCEVPECARCCLCFPLRLGLIAIAYIKLICCVIFILQMMVDIEVKLRFKHYDEDLFFTVNVFIYTAFLFVELAFNIIFIISTHKKDQRKMKLFYREAIFSIVFYAIGFVWLAGYVLLRYGFYFIQYVITTGPNCLFIVLIQAYIIFLVRSEIRKLERNSRLQFVNNASEVEGAKVNLNNIDE